MPDAPRALLHRLARERRLPKPAYQALVEACSPALAEEAAQLARAARDRVYGPQVFVRGLIEISNVCRNDCYYCGIRRSNTACTRYSLSPDEILACCQAGRAMGFRSFVLQGGESAVYSVDLICRLAREIKHSFPDSALTLSLGEYPRAAYRAMREAGVDRYLLRHETADPAHYAALHPPGLSLGERMRCLADLKALGFQTGCGFMVGSPGQTAATLAEDLAYVEAFAPEMCGIGPFLPHHQTPLGEAPPGSLALTLFLLSLLRLMHPSLLLPATTALCTLHPEGRERGIRAGANVVMPNLSPQGVRSQYELYDHKLSSGAESAGQLRQLRLSIEAAGGTMRLSRGDWVPHF